jgi:anti-sigma regulatory factor (Ser/Thr protein kinase)
MSGHRQRGTSRSTRTARPDRISVQLHPEPAAVPVGRQALDRLEPSLERRLFDELRLLVSELVTNSVRHARMNEDAWIDMEVDVLPDVVRARVSDRGKGFAAPPLGKGKAHDRRAGDPVQISGWGLYLVEQVANRWGIEPEPDGVSVWFEIDRGAA